MLLRTWLVWAALAVAGASLASASVVAALELDDLVRQADHIVVGRVVDQTPRWDSRRRIVTDVGIRLERVLKGGRRTGERANLIRLGGSVGDVGMLVPGEPGFRDGERVLLFAYNSVDGVSLRPVGMSQGVMRLEATATGERVVPGGGGLSLVNDGTGTQPGWLTGTAQPAPRGLDDVLLEIRGLVESGSQP